MSLLVGRLFIGSQYRQFLLATVISVVTASVPALFARLVASGPGRDVALPALTGTWLHWSGWAWSLPAMVLLIWVLKLLPPRSGSVALAVAYGGALLMNAVAVIAVWTSLLALPGNL